MDHFAGLGEVSRASPPEKGLKSHNISTYRISRTPIQFMRAHFFPRGRLLHAHFSFNLVYILTTVYNNPGFVFILRVPKSTGARYSNLSTRLERTSSPCEDQIFVLCFVYTVQPMEPGRCERSAFCLIPFLAKGDRIC